VIYLTTGANGAGKTLLTLKDVREQQLKENRPVYYHGFDMDPAKAAEFGWQTFDPKDWQALPDGSICIMDECQNEFPLRRSGSEVPDYVNAIAQHRRRRGFDFWLICPHPSLLDVFVRRLIDKPSWHRHLKRAFGADVVSVLKFGAPDMKCEEPGAGSRGEVSMRPYPKEVYSWYRSASLHTGKKKIPRAVYVVAAAAVIVPAALIFALQSVKTNLTKNAPAAAETAPAGQGATVPAAAPPARQDAPLVKLTAAEYLTLRQPRIKDFPHTAPAYDQITQPTIAPYPAACVSMGQTCKCFTQQGTSLQTAGDVCLQIVRNGFFVDWQQPADRQDREARQHRPAPERVAAAAPAAQTPVVNVHLPATPPAAPQPGAEWSQGLARRNAQVRSIVER